VVTTPTTVGDDDRSRLDGLLDRLREVSDSTLTAGR
jgi:hypothetical protein